MTSYTDDTSVSVSHKLLSKILSMLEEDALNVLSFMASNGLMAHATKMAFMILNNKKKKASENQDTQCIIKIGDMSIKSETSAKLLGITIDSNQKWTSQINGVGGTVKSLNSRLYLLKRLSKSINKKDSKE